MEEKIPIGIEDITVALPRFFVTAEDLAARRKQPVDKYKKGIGIERFSVLYDTTKVELAARAIAELMKRNNLTPEQISRIYTATESSEDESKALGTYVFGELEKTHGLNFEHTQTCEEKMACVSSSFAIISACEHIAANPNKMAIVSCTDEAKYALESRGEPTQGAGSLAILIKAKPDLIEILYKHNQIGCSVKDTREYYRPPGIEFPILEGDQTERTYIERMIAAYKDHIRKTQAKRMLSGLQAVILHTPYPGMVRKTSGYLLAHLENDSVKKFCAEIGLEIDGDFQKKLRASAFFADFYHAKVAPGLVASSQIGNLYTGSLPLSLLSFLVYGNLKKGDVIGFGGFGSGSEALVYKGECVNPKGRTYNLNEELRSRQKIDFDKYESWRRKISWWLEKTRKEIVRIQKEKVEKGEV